jgi:hypothetical protein
MWYLGVFEDYMYTICGLLAVEFAERWDMGEDDYERDTDDRDAADDSE